MNVDFLEQRRNFLKNAPIVLFSGPVFAAGSASAETMADGSTRIERLIAESRQVMIPAGRYVINKTIEIPAGTKLSGAGGCVLVRSAAFSGPLIRCSDVKSIVIEGIAFEAKKSNPIIWEQKTGEDRFSVPLSLPWRYPALKLTAKLRNGGNYFLQPVEDFIVSKVSNESVDIIFKKAAWRTTGTLFSIEVPFGLDAFVAIENSTDVRLSGLAMSGGSIAFYSDGSTRAGFAVSKCEINEGQIRVIGRKNNFYPLPQFTEPDLMLSGPSDIAIIDNKILGSANRMLERRRLRFSERMHGIVVSGYSRNVQIKGNEVTHALGDGLSIPSVEQVKVENNVLIGNALSGIGPENGTLRRSRGFLIAGNRSVDNWFDGLDFNFVNPLNLSFETASSRTRGEIVDAVITENKFLTNGVDGSDLNGGCGIYVRFGRNIKIADNICNGNNVNGIKVQISADITLSGNECSGNGRTGRALGDPYQRAEISIEGSTGVMSSNNRIGVRDEGMVNGAWRGRLRGNVKSVVEADR